MSLGSTELMCPNCKTVFKTKGVGVLAIIVIAISTFITLGIGLIVGLIYLYYIGKRPAQCPNCGFKE